MSGRLAPRVKETTTSTGTGTIDLAGAVAGFQTFVGGIGNGNQCYYTLLDGNAWEVGLGTVTDSSPDTLSRSVIASTNSDALLTLAAGTKDVFVSATTQNFLDGPQLFHNAEWSASVVANALTIALKTLAGTDPSLADPVRVAFPSTTQGQVDIVDITAALSFTLSAGSTLGGGPSETIRMYLYLVNNAGAPVIGVTRQALFDEGRTHTTTAEGGAGGADSNILLYTTAAQTSKAVRLVGVLEAASTATPGNWTSPSQLSVWVPGMRKTGDIVQQVLNIDNAEYSTTTTVGILDTKPQITEGAALHQVSMTPTNAINRLIIEWQTQVGSSESAHIVVALFKDSNADALFANFLTTTDVNYGHEVNGRYAALAGGTVNIDWKLRFGPNTGTAFINKRSAGSLFDGTMMSTLKAWEVFV